MRLPPRYISMLATMLLAGASFGAPAASPPDRPDVARVIARLTQDSLTVDRLVNRGQRDSAHVILKGLISEARATADPATIARALFLDAAQDCRVGLGADALPFVNEGRKFAEASGDTGVMMWGLRVEWMARGYTGPPSEVQRITQRIGMLAERSGNPEYEGWAHACAGYVAFKRGNDPVGARRDMEWALQRFEEIGHGPGTLFCENMVGTMLLGAGDYAGARPHFQRLQDLAQKLDRPQMKAYAIGNLGTIEDRIGDPARAIEWNRAALAIHLQRGGISDALVVMDNIVNDLLALGRVDEARAMAEQALAQAEQHDIQLEIPWQRQTLADALARDGRPEAAKRLWRDVIALGDSADISPRVISATDLAEALADEDSLAEALAVVEDAHRRLAARAESQPRVQLLTLESRLLIAANRPAEALRIVAPIAEQLEREGDLELALAAWTQVVRAERRLGDGAAAERAIARATAVWEQGRRAPSDPEFREQRSEQARMLTVESVEHALAYPPAAPESQRIATAFARLQQFTTRTLLERMAGPRAFGADSALEQRVPALELARFQSQVLRPDDLFLQFVSGPDTTLVFAVLRDSCRVAGLPGTRALTERLGLGRGLFAKSDPTAADAVVANGMLKDMGEQLLGGVGDWLRRSRRVIVAPDGELHRVPFAALVPPGATEPLLATHRVEIVPSAAFLAVIRAHPSSSGRGLLAIAGVARPGEAAVPGAQREVRDLGARYREVEVWHAGDLDRSALNENPATRGLHFAGHTEVDDQLPWRSGLRIASRGSDTLLTASEIASRRVESPLVVLSSCESAGGRARSGEGVAGLASAFVIAGAPTVVATLWPVDDAVTARLITRFYEGLAHGLAAGEALRQAQDWVRRTPGTEHPFYWAGLVLVGDGETRLGLTPRGPAFGPILGWVAVALVLVLLMGAIVSLSRRGSSRSARPGGAPGA